MREGGVSVPIRRRTWIEQSVVRLRTDSSRGELDVKNGGEGIDWNRPTERPIHLMTSPGF